MSHTTDVSIWLDWETLYLDDLVEQTTVEERRWLIAALERGHSEPQSVTTLSPRLAGKAERFVAFATRDDAPTNTLFRAAAAHLRKYQHQRRPVTPARRYPA